MKKILLSVTVALALLVTTGCSAIIEREYTSVIPHSETPKAENDSKVLRVESYQEMVNALLYLVTEGEEEGALRLYDYPKEKVEGDLAAASLEVLEEDPLGAFSVKEISTQLTPILAYDEVDIQIDYCRTRAEVDAIVNAIGVSAIRNKLADALEQFSESIVLRTMYFEGGEEHIRTLIEQAYFQVPASALGHPEVDVTLYPETGAQQIVEIIFDYEKSPTVLGYQQSVVEYTAQQMLLEIDGAKGTEILLNIGQAVLDAGGLHSDNGSTAYDALTKNGADAEGLALAMAALCRESNLYCAVLAGERNGEPHVWNVVMTETGYRHMDMTQGAAGMWDDLDGTESYGPFFSDRTALEQDYEWNRSLVPLCGQQPEK